jgi:hypothetical protein
VHDRALPSDTAYVLYAKVNALFYSGLRSPFPYVALGRPGPYQRSAVVLDDYLWPSC